jgi:hypothetical protein
MSVKLIPARGKVGDFHDKLANDFVNVKVVVHGRRPPRELTHNDLKGRADSVAFAGGCQGSLQQVAISYKTARCNFGCNMAWAL